MTGEGTYGIGMAVGPSVKERRKTMKILRGIAATRLPAGTRLQIRLQALGDPDREAGIMHLIAFPQFAEAGSLKRPDFDVGSGTWLCGSVTV